MIIEKIIYIHIYNEKHKKTAESFKKQIMEYAKNINIKCEIVIDNNIHNRSYPYFTINDKVICMRKLLMRLRRGKI